MSAEPPLNIYSLPLFPLHHVLFPQFPIQLHVFEERYRTMIDACIARDERFGVVLIREGEEVGAPAVPHEVGCVARIQEIKRLEDGRIHLLALAEGRFRLLDYREAEQPYLIGRVEAFDDAPVDTDTLLPLTTDLRERFRSYLGLLAKRANLPLPAIELPDDPALLAFCVASVTQLPALVKQSLLETTDTRARMQQEIILLEEQIEELHALRDAPQEEDADMPSLVKVLIAHPLDFHERDWEQYRYDARN